MNGAGKRFMELTTYGKMDDPPQRRGSAQPPLELPAESRAERVALPDASKSPLGAEPLLDIMNRRRSLRGYGQRELSLEELSFLLWCCQGVQEQSERYTMRTVPSAGARHALETWVLVNRVKGLRPGLYRYLALSGELAAMDLADDAAERLKAACLNQGMVLGCAAAFFWEAVAERMYFRYGERGYRYLHLDAGHACQNLCLAAEAIGGGACPIGAFDDDILNKELGLDGENRFVIYGATVGKKP